MGPWQHACVLVPRVGATPRWHEALACLARHRYAKLTLAMNAIMLGLDFVPFTEAYAPHGGTLCYTLACSLLHVAPCMSEPLLLRSKLKDIKLRETKRKINVSARHDSVSATPRSGRSASSAAASHDRAVGRAPIAFALPAGIVCPAGSPDRSTDPACAQLSLARTMAGFNQ